MRPKEPISVDEFPRDFILVCPRFRQVQSLSHYNHKYASGIFGPADESWFWKIFAQPVRDLTPPDTVFQPSPRPLETLAAIEKLPAELLDMILDELSKCRKCEKAQCTECKSIDERPLLALALTSMRLWIRIVPHIRPILIQKSAAWSAWRYQDVSFRGRHSTLTDHESDWYLGSHWEMFGRMMGKPHGKLTIHENMIEYPVEGRWKEHLGNDWRYQELSRYISPKFWDIIYAEISTMRWYPQDKAWVLRNRYTRQFVRSDRLCPSEVITAIGTHSTERAKPGTKGIRKLWKKITNRSSPPYHHDDNAPLSLAQIFLVMTCFSDNFQNNKQHELLSLHSGPWASGAFDVVLLDDHLRDSPCDMGPTGDDPYGVTPDTPGPWTDVTDAVVADVANLRCCLRQYEMASQKEHRSKDFRDMIGQSRKQYRAWATDIRYRPAGCMERYGNCT